VDIGHGGQIEKSSAQPVQGPMLCYFLLIAEYLVSDMGVAMVTKRSTLFPALLLLAAMLAVLAEPAPAAVRLLF
jgi:hypothetical protein